MTRAWPDSLPGIRQPGYQLVPVDPAIRTDMEVGDPRLRRRTFARRDMVEGAYIFTDGEMNAFRAWYGDENWSWAGESQGFSGWTANNMTVLPEAIVGPADRLAARLTETAATGPHAIVRAIAAPASGPMLLRATLRSAGRRYARLTLLDRTGTYAYVGVDLHTGLVVQQGNATKVAVTSRENLWWRVSFEAPNAAGGATPYMSILLLDDALASDYAGSTLASVEVCELNALLAADFEQPHLTTDALGQVVGAAGGTAWFQTALFFGGGWRPCEARFDAPFTARQQPGLNWEVGVRLRVRNV
jgi:hypothetical protein